MRNTQTHTLPYIHYKKDKSNKTKNFSTKYQNIIQTKWSKTLFSKENHKKEKENTENKNNHNNNCDNYIVLCVCINVVWIRQLDGSKWHVALCWPDGAF